MCVKVHAKTGRHGGCLRGGARGTTGRGGRDASAAQCGAG